MTDNLDCQQGLRFTFSLFYRRSQSEVIRRKGEFGLEQVTIPFTFNYLGLTWVLGMSLGSLSLKYYDSY